MLCPCTPHSCFVLWVWSLVYCTYCKLVLIKGECLKSKCCIHSLDVRNDEFHMWCMKISIGLIVCANRNCPMWLMRLENGSSREQVIDDSYIDIESSMGCHLNDQYWTYLTMKTWIKSFFNEDFYKSYICYIPIEILLSLFLLKPPLQFRGTCTDHVFNSREDLSEDNLAFGIREFPLCSNLGVELSSSCVLHHQMQPRQRLHHLKKIAYRMSPGCCDHWESPLGSDDVRV